MEVYGLNLFAAMDSGVEPGFVAALSVQLPPGSRVRVAMDPDEWWTGERLLMAALVNNLRGLIWGMADKKKRGPEPKPIGPASVVKGSERKLAMVAMSREQLLEELAKPRKGADDG